MSTMMNIPKLYPVNLWFYTPYIHIMDLLLISGFIYFLLQL